MHSHIDFGYSWFWASGHAVVTAVVLPLFVLGLVRKWNKAVLVIIGVVTLWSFTSFLMVRLGFDLNGRMSMPTEAFLSSGTGKVLDMGAGSGRSSLMVLEARPKATLVALDRFSTEYAQHFGTDGKNVLDAGRERLLANFRAAGVEQRASIQPGDMRQMPFEAATFDAIVSTYAIDHLNRNGITSALSEAFRVLKPRGEFLLMVLRKDFWMNYTFGPMLLHARMPGADRWAGFLHDAGFEITEQGTRPATLYFVARKPGM